MSYQESLLPGNSYDSQAGHPSLQIPPSTEPRYWMYVRVAGLILFFALVLFAPAILRGNNKRSDSPFNYTYLSCEMDPTTRLCTTPYTLYQSATFESPNANETIIVRGHFDDIVAKTGWGSLIIQSFNVFDDTEQMKAVGYLEGFLTAARITDTMTNENATAFNTRPADAQERLSEWLSYQHTYIQSQIDIYVKDGDAVKPSTTQTQKEYWSAVNLVQLQHAGLKLGYEEAVKQSGQVPAFDLDLWANRADFGDVFANIYPERTKNCWDMTVGELDEYIGQNEHCSSISKATIDLIGSNIKCRPVQPHDDESVQTKTTVDEYPDVIFTQTIKVTEKTECDFTYTLDFAVAHDTWTTFSEMLRIIKVYKLQLNAYAKKIDKIRSAASQAAVSNSTSPSLTQNIISAAVSAALELSNFASRQYTNFNHQIDETVDDHTFILSLSGYPGALTSYDDYYVMPSPHQQLIVTETTNSNCNKELYTKISSRSILTTKRTLIASMLSFDANEWANTYARENSGTYNNQWMIVDGKKWDNKKVSFDIVPATTAIYEEFNRIDSETTFHQSDFLAQVIKVDLQKGFYVIAEQMPGAVIVKDVTDFVNQNAYWPSFNRPYSQEVYFAMGFDRAAAAWGDFYDYHDYARAQIMFRDLPVKHVVARVESNDDPAITKPLPTSSLADLMAYMRYNDFKNDNLSRNCAIYAIASRYDLIPDEGCGMPVSKTNARGQTDVKMATMNSIKRQSPIIGDNEIQNKLLTSVNVIDWTWNRDIHTYNTRKTATNLNNHLLDTNFPPKKTITNTTDAMFWVIAGPTTEQQPMFDWTDPKWENFTHVGLPDQFNFNWVQLNH